MELINCHSIQMISQLSRKKSGKKPRYLGKEKKVELQVEGRFWAYYPSSWNLQQPVAQSRHDFNLVHAVLKHTVSLQCNTVARQVASCCFFLFERTLQVFSGSFQCSCWHEFPRSKHSHVIKREVAKSAEELEIIDSNLPSIDLSRVWNYPFRLYSSVDNYLVGESNKTYQVISYVELWFETSLCHFRTGW